jgi:hypothetical protein
MQLRAAGVSEALVDHVTRDGVLEDVVDVVPAFEARRQIGSVQRLQAGSHGLRTAQLRSAAPKPSRHEAAPNHARHLERRLLALAELVDAGQHDPTQALRQLFRPRGDLARGRDTGRARAQERGQLLDEERIATRARSYRRDQVRWQLLSGEGGAQRELRQGLAARRGELDQLEQLALRRLEQPLLALEGPGRRDKQHPQLGDVSHDVREQLARRPAHPVCVFEEQQQRTPARRPAQAVQQQ